MKRTLAFFSLAAALAACSSEFTKPPPSTAPTSTVAGEDAGPPEDGGGPIPLPDGAVEPTTPLTYISDLTIQIMPGDKGQSILDAIRGAKTSVHVEMYLLTNNAMIAALKAAKQAGRDVKVVLNEDFPTNRKENASVLAELKADTAPWARQMPAFVQMQMGNKQAAYEIMVRMLASEQDNLHPNEVNAMVEYICTRALEPAEALCTEKRTLRHGGIV